MKSLADTARTQLILIICRSCICEFPYLLMFVTPQSVHGRGGRGQSRRNLVPDVGILAATEPGGALPWRFSSCTGSKGPSGDLFRAIFFSILCFCCLKWLPSLVLKCCLVFLTARRLLCLTKKISVR